MIDFVKARSTMVESQVRTNDVTDRRLQDAMLTVPREWFVPKSKRDLAYMGEVIEIGDERYLMDPRTFAKLAQVARIKSSDVILDVGCGTGYSTAVLAFLGDAVVAVEAEDTLADTANHNLTQLGLDNAAVVTGDLTQGCPDQGPFDVIFVSGGVEFVPDAWTNQLKDAGRLVVVIVEGKLGRAHIMLRTGSVVADRIVFDATIPVLPGFEREEEFVF